MNKINKIVVVGHNNSGSHRIARALISSFPEIKFLIIETTGIYYKKSFLNSICKLLRESSITFCAWRFFELIKFKLKNNGLRQLAEDNNFEYFKTSDINSSDSLDRIASFSPDLLSSLYTMHIYKNPVINIPRICSITAHPSKIPMYRGLEVFFWQLANDEKESAVSVFELTSKVDIGKIFWQREFSIKQGETVEGLYTYITQLACEGIIDVIRSVDSGTTMVIPPAQNSSYYPMPTRKAVRKFLASNKKFF